MRSRYVICDIEATGLHVDKDLLEITKIVDFYETLVNPEVPVPAHVCELTGISRKDLEGAPKFYEVADSIRLRLARRRIWFHEGNRGGGPEKSRGLPH